MTLVPGQDTAPGFRVADHPHVAAGFGPDGFLVADQHEAPRGQHRFGQRGIPGRDQLQGADRQLLDHGRAVAGDELPGRAGGGVVRQLLLGFDQCHAAFAGQGGCQGQSRDPAANDHHVISCCHGYILADVRHPCRC